MALLTSAVMLASAAETQVAINTPLRGAFKPVINGSIAAANTSQIGVAADANRRYLLFFNTSANDMWLNFGTTAAAVDTGVLMEPGSSYEFPYIPTGAVNIFCAVAASKYIFIEA